MDWYLTDNQGTVRDVVQFAGGVTHEVDHIIYDPYGNPTQAQQYASLPLPRFTYDGEWQDPKSGLVKDGLRWYDAVDGVFASQDPLGFGGGDTNTSRYCGNSPTNHIDPSGMNWLFSDYWYYLTNPSQMDPDLRAANNVAYGMVAVGAGGLAGAGVIAAGASTVAAGAVAGGSGSAVYSVGSQWTNNGSVSLSQTAYDTATGTAMGAGMGALPARAALVVGTGFAGYGAYENGSAAVSAFRQGNYTLGAVNTIAGGASLALGIVGIRTALGSSGGGTPCRGETACFVAGTPVLVPDESKTQALIVSAMLKNRISAANDNWLIAIGVVMVGIAGYVDETERAKHARKRRKVGLELLLQLGENDNDRLDRDPSNSGPRKFGVWRASGEETDRATEDYCASISRLETPMLQEETCLLSSIADVACPSPENVASGENALSVHPALQTENINNAMAVQALAHSSHRTKMHRTSQAAKTDNTKPTARHGQLWLAACLLIAALFAGKAVWPPSALPVSAPNATPVSSVAAKRPAYRSIEAIRVGQRVIAANPDSANSDSAAATAVDPTTWRLLRLHAEDRWSDGTLDTIEVETLQPLKWIKEHDASPGAMVPLPLDLVEMGMPETLHATVQAIEPCPPIAGGSGKVVLTTVNHLNAHVFALQLSDPAGRNETVRATGFHKFFSTDRRRWVSVEDLRRGEHLPGFLGLLTVKSLERLPGLKRVYNMTVESDHVYHVATFGALVHNNDCAPAAERPTPNTSLPDRVTNELPPGEIRTPEETAQARNFFERNRDAAEQWWSDRNGGEPWPEDATNAGHNPRAIGDGGDPLLIEPEFDGPNAPHMVPGPDGLTDFQRWGMRGGRPPGN